MEILLERAQNVDLILKVCFDGVINLLPNDKILGVTKLKAFADAKLNVARMMISLLERVENTRKKRKCWLPAFSPFRTVFLKGSLKVGIVW